MVYTTSFTKAPRDLREKLNAAVGRIPRAVKHRIVASTPQGQRIAEMMEFHNTDAVSFTFSSEFDGSTEETRRQFGATPGEHDGCARLILSRASSLFYVTILFPMLARTMKGYEIR